MSGPELSRPVKLKGIPNEPVILEADEGERAALARRFAITSIEYLRAEVKLDPEGTAIKASGTLRARITQACAIAGDDFPVVVEEDLAFVFVPAGPAPTTVESTDIEIELDGAELDEIEYSGDSFDLGEAVAQSLALAIDPYAEGPDADAVRKKTGIVTDDIPTGPLAEALAALKKN